MTSESKMNFIESFFRILTGLIGLLFLALGLGFAAFPDLFAMAFSAQPLYIQGLNAIRGDFGGLFLGMSFFCFLGAATRRWSWLVVPILLLVLIITGRLISFGQDGLSAAGTRSLIIETVLLIILTISAVVLAKKGGTDRKGLRITEILNFKTLISAAMVAAILTGLMLSSKKIGMALVEPFASRSIAVDRITNLQDGLHVGLCGTCGPFADPRRANSCEAVIAGKSLYVVDIGPGSERKMEIMKLNPGQVRAVLLTHFHSDHIGDLGELMLKRWAGGSKKLPLEVFGPTGVETVVKGFNQAYTLDDKYRILHHGPEVVPPSGAGGLARTFDFPAGKEEVIIIDAEGLKVTAFLVDHGPVKPAVGYRFDYKGRSVVISGDTSPSRVLSRQAKGADLLVHESLQRHMVRTLQKVSQKSGRINTAKVMGDIQNYHTSPEEAAQIASEAEVRYLLLTHLLPPLPVSDLKPAFMGDAKKIFRGPITIAEDGMFFTLPAGNKKILKSSFL